MDFKNMKKSQIKKYIEKNYTNPNCAFSFSGLDKVYNHIDKRLNKDEIKNILLKKESYTLMKQEVDRKKNKVYTPITAFHFLDNLQSDLIDVSRLANYNNKVNFLFCIIDVFSRYSWIFPLKNKKSDSIVNVLKYFFRLNKDKVSNFSFDFGGEFKNTKVTSFLKRMNVKFWFTVSENKCSIVEIFQKYIQRKIYSYLVERETHQFIHVLPEIVNAYNNSKHSFHKISPYEATLEKNFGYIQDKHFSLLSRFHKKKKPKYKLGDIVRVSLDKKSFLKRRSYFIQNSYAKYEIYKICTKNSIQPKYYLKHVNSDEKIINGYFYENQLTLVKNDIFRGNIIDSRKNKNGRKEFLFQFKGYPNRFNQWISSKEIKQI